MKRQCIACTARPITMLYALQRKRELLLGIACLRWQRTGAQACPPHGDRTTPQLPSHTPCCTACLQHPGAPFAKCTAHVKATGRLGFTKVQSAMQQLCRVTKAVTVSWPTLRSIKALLQGCVPLGCAAHCTVSSKPTTKSCLPKQLCACRLLLQPAAWERSASKPARRVCICLTICHHAWHEWLILGRN